MCWCLNSIRPDDSRSGSSLNLLNKPQLLLLVPLFILSGQVFSGKRIDSLKMCHRRWHCSKQKEVRMNSPLMAGISFNWPKKISLNQSRKRERGGSNRVAGGGGGVPQLRLRQRSRNWGTRMDLFVFFWGSLRLHIIHEITFSFCDFSKFL